jgi:hypothetical protein
VGLGDAVGVGLAGGALGLVFLFFFGGAVAPLISGGGAFVFGGAGAFVFGGTAFVFGGAVFVFGGAVFVFGGAVVPLISVGGAVGLAGFDGQVPIILHYSEYF